MNYMVDNADVLFMGDEQFMCGFDSLSDVVGLLEC